MITNYTLDWSDPSKTPITIIGETKNASATSLVLSGKGTPNWGEPLQENLLKMMEHFASPTAPAMPTVGQLWYDTTVNPATGSTTLKLRLPTNVWEPIWPNKDVVISATAPVTPTTGLLWYDTTANQLKLYTIASVWSVVWPIVIPEEVIKSATAPVSPTIGLLWFDTTANQLKIYENGAIWRTVWPFATSTSSLKFSTGFTGTSASLCIYVSGNNFPPPRNAAIFQGRSASWIFGSGAIGGGIPGSYVAKTVSNPFATDMLIKCTLYPICNLYETTGAIGSSATYIHHVSDDLNVTPNGFGQSNTDVYPEWVYNQITTTTGNSSPLIPSVDPNPSFYGYTQETSPPAVFYKLLAPGQSTTIYGQWWLVQTSPGNFSCHAGSRLVIEGFANASAF